MFFGKPIEFQYLQNSLFFLIPILVLALMVLGAKKKQSILKLLKLATTMRLKGLKWALTVMGLLLIVVALMGPQQETGQQEIQSKGLDIYVLMDTSKSMLVEDTSPSRIERGKKIVEELLSNLIGDRIGFIPFASSAYIQMPLTDDYDLAKLFLNAIDTDMMSGSGTNIGEAMTLAAKSFDEASSGDCVIIVLSDGEEHDGQTQKIIEKLKQDHLKIYTIGLGTPEGGMIPVYSETGQRTGFKKDESGTLIMSKLDEASLQEIAKKNGGQYFRASVGSEETEALRQALAGLEKATLKTKTVKQYEQLFQWFLGLGLICLVASVAIPERSKPL